MYQDAHCRGVKRVDIYPELPTSHVGNTFTLCSICIIAFDKCTVCRLLYDMFILSEITLNTRAKLYNGATRYIDFKKLLYVYFFLPLFRNFLLLSFLLFFFFFLLFFESVRLQEGYSSLPHLTQRPDLD